MILTFGYYTINIVKPEYLKSDLRDKNSGCGKFLPRREGYNMSETVKNEKNYFGVMLDMSRNAVMKPEEVKKFADVISAMGYNMIQLYTEDTYEVENEPFFGYMRGRYTAEELKDIDAYCAQKGVELVPCVQTLAHLNSIFRWKDYYMINDVSDILLIDDERTYKLLENIFATLSKCFTSRLVNIGMDEAHLVGLGKYLDEHGYGNRFDILKRHLTRVIEIADKYGFKPMMWSDMFFRLANKGAYYSDKINIDVKVKESVPDGVSLVYWDYYHTDKKTYASMIEGHKLLSDNYWFAGGAWTWVGFAPLNHFTLRSMQPAMTVCREKGIKNIFITMWGDNGGECSYYSVLPSLYYIRKVYEGETDIKKIKKGFKEVTGEDFDAFMALDLPNILSLKNKKEVTNVCKYALYSDLFNNFMDRSLPEDGGKLYAGIKSKLRRLGKTSNYKYIFDSLADLSDLMSYKYGLGIELRKAYAANDKAQLSELAARIGTAVKKAEKFYKSFKTLWFKENKASGFDVQDIRLGGLIRRMESCRERIKQYIDGDIKEIEELEAPFIEEREKKAECWNNWIMTASANVF